MSSRLDRWCLSRLARHLPDAECHLRLWDGWTIPCSNREPVGIVTIRTRRRLWRLLRNPDLAFGEGYMNGEVIVTGDLTALMTSVNRALAASRFHPPREPRRGQSTSAASARQNVHHHYDLSNEFFRLWLDEAMVYTCAYFEHPRMSLEDAQRAKFDYVCRKLQLQPGDTVIEAGCGWGALAIHMAKHYGARVRAFNISIEQLRYAREQAVRHGVADRVAFIDDDFRSISGECDVFVSIGMLEHVGPQQYAAFGALVNRVMTGSGRGLIHFCGRNRPTPLTAWSERYIFPGAYPPALSEVATQVLEPWNFSVLDVENLRRHYALTLQHWRTRFERASAEITRMFDERFVRMWRLYLACSEACFLSGDMQLFQVTFGRATDNSGRMTRADLYGKSHRVSFSDDQEKTTPGVVSRLTPV